MKNQEFDLRPDPRVLPMLGEVNLEQWRCLAELIDNSVDGFLAAERLGQSIEDPKIYVTLPTSVNSSSQIQVRDTGPGMEFDTLERAVRAGWSGNNPIDSLGLFGMGFNIATARLGTLTTVWTTRKGDSDWVGLEIDFDKLRKQSHFKTPALTRPKTDPEIHGTEVTISNLKTEELERLAKGHTQAAVRRKFAQAYSAMLSKDGTPITFRLLVNDNLLEPQKHCVWGEERKVDVPGFGQVAAIQFVNTKLAERNYCTYCMAWLSAENNCPSCNSQEHVVKRERRIHGWLGIQRYLDQREYGVDFLRNGRKIEISNKELFTWFADDAEELEYPIDDLREGGRIVGEIHLDFCRVNYSKDRFDRADNSWLEMVRVIRGDGPLRPEKAKQLGYTVNESPMFRLYKAFRRGKPKSKVASAYARVLCVPDNVRAKEMAKKFRAGEPLYQEDSKWWELIEEADNSLLKPNAGPKDPESDSPVGPDGFLGQPEPEEEGPEVGEQEEPAAVPASSVQRNPTPSLSREYVCEEIGGLRFNIEAWSTTMEDECLREGQPWSLFIADVPTRTYSFVFCPENEVFQSETLTPLDALLSELAHLMTDTTRSDPQAKTYSEILGNMRIKYASSTRLDLRELATDAKDLLRDISSAIASNCPEEERAQLFEDLGESDRQLVMKELAKLNVSNVSNVISDGSFLALLPVSFVAKLIRRYPQHLFDDQFWDSPYAGIDFDDAELNSEARGRLVNRYVRYAEDLVWMIEQDLNPFGSVGRSELLRAAMSMRILSPDVEI